MAILMKRRLLTPGSALALLSLVAMAGIAQRGRFGQREQEDETMPARAADFHFLRLEYTDLPEFIADSATRRETGKAAVGG